MWEWGQLSSGPLPYCSSSFLSGKIQSKRSTRHRDWYSSKHSICHSLCLIPTVDCLLITEAEFEIVLFDPKIERFFVDALSPQILLCFSTSHTMSSKAKENVVFSAYFPVNHRCLPILTTRLVAI